MTEQEWLTATDPRDAILFLEGKVSERKLRLFGCACCRHIWHLLPDEQTRRAVEVVEDFVDGKADACEVDLAGKAAWRVAFEDYLGSAGAAAEAASETGADKYGTAFHVSRLCYHAFLAVGE